MQKNNSYPLNQIFIGILFLFSALFCVGCYKQPEQKKTATAVPVRTELVKQEDIQLYRYFTGTTDSVEVTIVPRIRGYLEECCFKPGELVEKDQILYKIEQFDYKNNLASAQAQLAVCKATAAKCKADYDRNMELSQKGAGFTTQADIDRTKALWEEAIGNISSAESKVREQEKELERTVIRSPIRGKISRTLVDTGNLVDGTGSNPPTLTSIREMDPIQVYFQLTDNEFNSLTNTIRKQLGDIRNTKPEYATLPLVEIAKREKLSTVILFKMGIEGLNSETSFPFEGYIDYNENAIDIPTGTITIRGLVKNPNYVIYPGNICKIQISGDLIKNGIAINEKAVCHDLNNKYVWVVDEKNMPTKRILTLGSSTEDGRTVVLNGLKAGDRYIVDGVLKVRGGIPVTEFQDKNTPSNDNKKPTTEKADSPQKVDAPKTTPAVTTPKTTEQKTAQPAVTTPKTTEQKTAQPAVTTPKTIEQKTTQPAVTTPKTIEQKTTQPAVTTPKTIEQKTTPQKTGSKQ